MSKKETIEDYLIWHYNNYQKFDLEPSPNSDSIDVYINKMESSVDPEEIQPWGFTQNTAQKK